MRKILYNAYYKIIIILFIRIIWIYPIIISILLFVTNGNLIYKQKNISFK